MKEPIVLFELCKSYSGKQVLSHVNLTLQPGSVHCLMAPSGGGKTTLLRILMGLEQADAGRLTGLKGLRIGAVFQEDRLLLSCSAVENVAMVSKLPPDEIKILLSALLPPDCLDQKTAAFSGGMRRRVALARAIAAENELLLLDEPFTGLDEETRQQAIAFVRAHRQGRTLVLATHRKDEALALGANIIKL